MYFGNLVGISMGFFPLSVRYLAEVLFLTSLFIRKIQYTYLEY